MDENLEEHSEESFPIRKTPPKKWTTIEEEIAHILEESCAEANHPVEREIFEAKKRALSGSAEAQVEIGKTYLEGILVEKNERAAINSFRRAADQGNAEAQYWLGWLYRRGLWVQRSSESALQYFQLAAKQGHAEALRAIAGFYEFGTIFKEDIDQTIHYYRLAAKNGSAEAQYWLGWMYYFGEGLEQSYEMAFKLYKQSADQEFLDAQEHIAELYEEGKGVEKSYRTAFHYYRLCADQGSKTGLEKLGDFYSEGKGVEQSDEKAFKYYQRADNDRKVAKCYYFGKGIEQSDEKACEHFDQVIEKGHEPWANDLNSKMIANEKALAEQGDSKSLFHMGIHYELGTYGVECSIKKAFDYYCRAIELGHARAMKIFDEYCQKHIFDCWTQANQALVESVFHRFLALVDQGSYQTLPWLASFHKSKYCSQKHAKCLISRFENAAEQGNLDALIALVVAYETGKGVEQSEEKSLDCKKRAARLGSVRAFEAIFDSTDIEEEELSSILKDFERQVNPKKRKGNLFLGRAYFQGKGAQKSYEKAFEHYKIAADKGAHDEGRFMTGLCYKNGWGVEQSDEKAHEYLKLAAEVLSLFRGSPVNPNDDVLLLRACSEIGHLYQENIGTEESCMHAISWHESAENYFEIAEAYRLGKGVDQSDEKALEYYRKAVERGDYRAFCSIGKCYQSGYLVEQSDEKAFECFQKAKDAYDGFAYFNVGECYRLGKEIPRSFEKALEYYRKGLLAGSLESSVGIAKCLFESQCIEGADAVGLEFLKLGVAFKNSEALYNLGERYRKGLGVEMSDEKAIEYYKEAAEAGLAEAIFALGVYRKNGFFLQGISAISCFEEAARRGVFKAYFALGECYRLGIEVDQSSEKAFACYEKAAEEGVPEALFELGNIYLLGRGVEIYEEKGFHYFKQSADHGFEKAAFSVGECYRLGIGVEQDDGKAFAYFKKAAEKGHPKARKHLEKVGRLDECGKTKKIPCRHNAQLFDELKSLLVERLAKEKGLAQTPYESQPDQGEFQTEEAIDLSHLKRMADVGDASAQFSLAELYACGDGVTRSNEISFLYFRLAADRGHPEAQAIVGDRYFSGAGIERSDRLTFKYFKLAAEQGESDGFLGISECYHLGKGVEQSDEKAFEFCKISADRRNAWAQAVVAEYYSQGKGVKSSLGKAVEYFSLLVSKGVLERLKNSIFNNKSYRFDLNACKIWLHHFLSEVITIADFTDRGSDIKQLRKIRNTVATEDLRAFVEYLSRWDIGGIAQMWKLFEGVSPTLEYSPISPLNRGWRVCGREEGLKSLKKTYGSLISARILKGFPSFVRLMKIVNFLEVERKPLRLCQEDIGGKDEQRSAA